MKKLWLAVLLVTCLPLLYLLRVSAADATNSSQATRLGKIPPEGFVPNAKAAIKIAEAVIEPVYGLETVKQERPYKARLVEGEWFVKGSRPTNSVTLMIGVSEVHIDKTNGCITFLHHWK